MRIFQPGGGGSNPYRNGKAVFASGGGWKPQGIIDRPAPRGGTFTPTPQPGSWGPQVPYRGLGPKVEGQVQQFKDQRQNLRGLIDQFGGQAAQWGPGSGWGVAGTFGPWENAPLPDDPYAADYRKYDLGGQRRSVMDLAQQLRPSNVRGMRVAGGANPYSQNVKNAYETLAGGYGDRYRQSMDYARGRVQDNNAQRQFLANLNQQGYGSAANALSSLLGIQKDYAFADEDRRRRDQEWGNQMSNQARTQRMEDVEWNQAQLRAANNRSLLEKNRQLYNQWSSLGPNKAQDLQNYFGGVGGTRLPSWMEGVDNVQPV